MLVALCVPAVAYVLIAAVISASRRTGAASTTEMSELRADLDELRHLPARLLELEERVDFAERLLAQREATQLPTGRVDQ